MYPDAVQHWLDQIVDPDAIAHRSSRLLAVDISTQTLTLYLDSTAVVSYPVSTSRYGVNCTQDSNGTPHGVHEIAEKIGAGEQSGEIFIGRIAQGRKFNDRDSGDSKDVITSRIIWLRGLQSGINSGVGCDSYDRYIYIHGTANEKKIGEAASIGCVRMLNADVIELFDRIEQGDRVVLFESVASG
ncbi:MAG: L,D-transpeptidase [Pseudomonadota bacterium]